MRRESPLGRPQDAQYIRELQILVGKQTVELEFLRAELDALKKGRGPRRPSR
jgi:hypothetical protein